MRLMSAALKLGKQRLGYANGSNVRPFGAEIGSEAHLDPVQRDLLEEPCILVDPNDNNIGVDSKRNCHLVGESGTCPLHRAFSVFLFNTKGELLLQQRSRQKITFPLYYTNTCCSHPLHTPSELEEDNAIGVRRAAQRRLGLELGIPAEQIPLDDFTYLTRIHYQAPSDTCWGEHEIDYILFLQKDVQVEPNPNEVEEVRFVSREDLKTFLEEQCVKGNPITPWFQLVVDTFLPRWWDNLGQLHKFQDHHTVHNLEKKPCTTK